MILEAASFVVSSLWRVQNPSSAPDPAGSVGRFAHICMLMQSVRNCNSRLRLMAVREDEQTRGLCLFVFAHAYYEELCRGARRRTSFGQANSG